MICSLFVFLHWLLEEQNNISSSRSSVDVGDDDLFSHTVCMEQGGVTMLRAVAKAKHTHTHSHAQKTHGTTKQHGIGVGWRKIDRARVKSIAPDIRVPVEKVEIGEVVRDLPTNTSRTWWQHSKNTRYFGIRVASCQTCILGLDGKKSFEFPFQRVSNQCSNRSHFNVRNGATDSVSMCYI